MARWIYTLLLRLAVPLLVFRLWIKSLKLPGYRARLTERFGFSEPTQPGALWIHAVSVGEVRAIEHLVNKLRAEFPQFKILITTITPTGAETVRSIFAETVTHRYLPWDTPGAVQRFLDTVQPVAGVIVETELWPNLLHELKQRSIPVLLANARLSEKSFRNYLKFPTLTRSTLDCLTFICAQFKEDRDRFIDLGVKPDQIAITGSIKFDATIDPDIQKMGVTWREALGERPVLVAVSTHEADEEVLLKAWQGRSPFLNRALLVLVPRHPDRFQSVYKRCTSSSFRVALRSEGLPTDATEIWLGDSLGELPAYLMIGTVAFIGGSFSGTGGHNPLEPALLKLPILMGPSQFNFERICRQLSESGALQIVHSIEELSAEIERLLPDRPLCTQIGDKGHLVVEQNQGATNTLLDFFETQIVERITI